MSDFDENELENELEVASMSSELETNDLPVENGDLDNNTHQQNLKVEYPENYDDPVPDHTVEKTAYVENLKLEPNGASHPLITPANPEKVGTKDFKVLKILGKGGFGTVCLVKKVARKDRTMTENDTGRFYAMKIVKKIAVVRDAKETMHTKAENNILKRVNHPFIVQLMYAFQTPARLFLVLEFVQGGELFTFLESENTLTEDWARFYLAEIALALGYLHSLNVIYRDLKPENILLGIDGHVKLTDFGLCKEDIQDRDIAMTYCGTIEYMAPEIVRKVGHNKAVDWWSLGTLMWDMIVGCPPFSGNTRRETIENIKRGRLPFKHVYMSRTAKHLIYQLLQKDPNQRLGIGRAENNGDVEQIKAHPFFKSVDFEKLYRKEITPPHIAAYGRGQVSSIEDVTAKFDSKFVQQPLTESLNLAAPEKDIPESQHADVFDGFSHVDPLVMASYGMFNKMQSQAVQNGEDPNFSQSNMMGTSLIPRELASSIVDQCAKILSGRNAIKYQNQISLQQTTNSLAPNNSIIKQNISFSNVNKNQISILSNQSQISNQNLIKCANNLNGLSINSSQQAPITPTQQISITQNSNLPQNSNLQINFNQTNNYPFSNPAMHSPTNLPAAQIQNSSPHHHLSHQNPPHHALTIHKNNTRNTCNSNNMILPDKINHSGNSNYLNLNATQSSRNTCHNPFFSGKAETPESIVNPSHQLNDRSNNNGLWNFLTRIF